MTRSQRLARWAEMLLLFVGGPLVLWALPGILGGGRLFLFLWLCAGACLVFLFRDKGFDRARLWVPLPASQPEHCGNAPLTGGSSSDRTPDPHPNPLPGREREPSHKPTNAKNEQPWPRSRYVFDRLGWVVLRWVILGVVVVTTYGLFAGKVVFGLRVPVEMFGLPRRVPQLFFAIALFYPWFSVYPQNVIYRAFFCRRYAPLLGSGWAMILANAALFSFGHFMFGNWIVLALTFIGGVLFTRTYLRSGSLLLAVIEHALYGLLCFSIGIGIYLLYGALS